MLVAVGLALAFGGYAVERRQPAGFNRGKAVGWSLFVLGEVLLFEAGGWWGTLGLVAPTLLIDGLLALFGRGRGAPSRQ